NRGPAHESPDERREERHPHDRPVWAIAKTRLQHGKKARDEQQAPAVGDPDAMWVPAPRPGHQPCGVLHSVEPAEGGGRGRRPRVFNRRWRRAWGCERWCRRRWGHHGLGRGGRARWWADGRYLRFRCRAPCRWSRRGERRRVAERVAVAEPRKIQRPT